MEQRRYACDGCRRRRIRCDATQPCSQCVRHGISCTYGSTTSRQSATVYARTLEQQVAELQRQLAALTELSSDHTSQPTPQLQHIDLLVAPNDALVLEQGNEMKVYTSSAALNVLRTIVNMLTTVATTTPSGQALVEAFETPTELPNKTSLDWLEARLPDKDQIWDRVNHAIDIALVCHDCIDKDSIRARLIDMPSTPVDAKSSPQYRSFLALIYALLAIGDLYDHGIAPVPELQQVKPPGLNYFRASRCILNDEHEHVDLESITAMWLHSRYLLSASNFSDAHAALTRAISAAMHMGLHLDDSALRSSISEAELYRRRKVFAVLYAAEIYIAFPLGLPRTLRIACAKQTLGLSDDEWLDEGVALLARDATTTQAETILNQKLQSLCAKILDHQSEQSLHLYPNLDWISAIETELREWEQLLPPLSEDLPSDRKLQGQLSLRLHYTAAYIFLYAPCLHHLGRQRTDPAWNLQGYEYGSACLRAASQAVFLMSTVNAHGLLNRTNWVNTYLLAWTATILAYFILSSPTRVTIAESKRAAMRAYKLLEYVGTTNAAARKIHECIASSMALVSTINE